MTTLITHKVQKLLGAALLLAALLAPIADVSSAHAAPGNPGTGNNPANVSPPPDDNTPTLPDTIIQITFRSMGNWGG